jgi:hypothetical protein
MYYIIIWELHFMDRLILFLFILFFIGFFYSFIVQRFTKSRIIMLIPTILGIILIIYNSTTSNPSESSGLEALNIFIKELIITTIIIGNISGLIFFILHRK